ncbi:MAG: hypothetical protein ACRDJY_05220 [Thermoleophilaceae bacterium]
MNRFTLWAVLLLALAALVAAGCGGDDDDEEGAAPPPAEAEDFPDPAGKTLAQLREGLGPGPVLAPSVGELEPGKNRFGFGLFDRARKQIVDAPAALYVAPLKGGAVRGPFPARYESLEVKPQFQSEGVKADPDSATSVYVSDVRFGRPGDYEVFGVVELDDNLVAAERVAVRVKKDSKVPEPDERAIEVSTPTTADVGGDIAQIDTRVPPTTMHDANLADVLGEKPVMLIFATPALCQSRVCGPVVDIAEQVKASYDGDAEFIHMEIYNDNELDKGFRQQVVDWNLPTEPWAFTIDREGKVAARLEGAFSARELEAALEKAE